MKNMNWLSGLVGQRRAASFLRQAMHLGCAVLLTLFSFHESLAAAVQVASGEGNIASFADETPLSQRDKAVQASCAAPPAFPRIVDVGELTMNIGFSPLYTSASRSQSDLVWKILPGETLAVKFNINANADGLGYSFGFYETTGAGNYPKDLAISPCPGVFDNLPEGCFMRQSNGNESFSLLTPKYSGTFNACHVSTEQTYYLNIRAATDVDRYGIGFILTLNAAGSSSATSTPLCTLTATPSTVTPGSPSTLTATCTPAASSYTWSGAGCESIKGSICTVTPTVKTTYSVIGSNSVGKSNTATATVDVSTTTTPTTPTFKCSLSASPASISAGESSTLTASCNPAGASYTWSGASCSGATCKVTPTAMTFYTVTGKLGAETSIASAIITVTPKATTAPVCKVSQNPGNPVTTASVKLTAECTPAATSYVWTGGQCLNGNTEQTCMLLTPSAKTTYSVTGSNSFGKSTASAIVEVSSSSNSLCTLSPNHNAITLGLPVTLTASCPGLNVLHYQWSANTGCQTDAGPTCTFTPTTVGVLSYNVTVGMALGKEDTPSTNVTVTAATPAKPVCELMAFPLTVTAGSPVTLTANCVPSTGTSYLWSSNTSCNGSATCAVTPTADTTYTVKGSNAGGESDLQSVSVKVIPAAAASYQGLWWNPNESGWGISVTQHSDKIFAAIYTYDAAGKPTWYALSDCPILADKPGRCTGDIYKVTGGSTPLVPWVGPVTAVLEGTGTFTFSDASHGKFDYTFTVDGVKRSEAIEKFAFASGTTKFPVDYTDLWWSEGESGWGVALTQDQGMIFAAWYAYNDTGNPVWYTASSCPLTGTAMAGSCTGTLYRVTGGLPLSAPSDGTHPVSVMDVGLVAFQFSDKDHADMTYSIDGKLSHRPISRFGF